MTMENSWAIGGAANRWRRGVAAAGLALFGFVLLMVGAPHPVAAAEIGLALQSVDIATLPGDKVQLKLGMSGPAPEPSSFTIDNPARIALDFPGVHNALPQQTQSIGVGAARSLTAVEAQGRTRLVINLVQMVPFETRREGNDLYVVIGGTASARAAPAPGRAALATKARRAPAGARRVVDINFQRGDQSFGQGDRDLLRP